MKMWPLSLLKNSSLMPQAYAYELENFYARLPPQHVFEACLSVARGTQPLDAPNLLIVESVSAPLRPIYSDYPEWDEWFRLERANVFQGSNGFLFMSMEALH